MIRDDVRVEAAGTRAWPPALVDEYRERYGSLVRVAAMMLGSRSESEEVVQDAFVSTARTWERVRDVRPYVRRAVVNGAIGVLRRRRTAAAYRPDAPPTDAAPQLVELRDLLLALPPRQRAVLVMRFVDDASDDEIAAALGCRRATVRSLAARGLAALRKELT